MKFFNLLIFLFIFSISLGQVTYDGNGNTSFGDVVGNSTLEFNDNGTTITGTFTKGPGAFNDAMVIYISNGSSGRNIIDSDVNDQADGLRRTISSAGTNSSDITFPTGFEATHAIAIDTGFGGIWSIPSTGTVGNGGLGFIDAVGNPSSSTQASFTFSFDWSDIGLTGTDDFQFIVTYLNSSNGFTSNEGYGANFLNSNNLFDGSTNIGSSDFTALNTYTYPSPNRSDNMIYNDLYKYFNPFNSAVKYDTPGANVNDDDIASWAYAANDATGFGGIATFDNPTNASWFTLTQASVVMSNWDTNTSAFQHPFTLEIYEVDRSGANPAPGNLLAEITQEQTVPPRENFTSVDSPNAGYTDSASSDFLITFDMCGVSVNADEVLFMVSFDYNGTPNDSFLDAMNIASYSTGTPATPTTGTKTGNDVFWRSPSNTSGQISQFNAGTVVSRFQGVAGQAPRQWTGAVDNDFSNAGNWAGGVAPVTGDNVVIPSGSSVEMNTSVVLDGLTVESTASLDVRSALRVNCNLLNNGTITFKNNSTDLGQFGEFTNRQISGSGGITVERFIPVATEDTRAFRFLTSAVDSDGSIYDNWQESGNSPAGFGTHITGNNNGTNGVDQTITGNPSMYTFDNSFTGNQNNAWNPVTDTQGNNLIAGEAYRMFIRGDRNYNLASNPPNAPNTDVTLRATGSLVVGDQTFNLSQVQDYYSLVGNPYQSIVNINDLNTTNVNNNFYWIWDPNMSQRGAYVTVSLPSGANPGTSAANQFIQPGQSFYVQTLNNGAADLTFTESSKDVSATPTSVFSNDSQASINVLLYKDDDLNNDDRETDALGINFSPNGNNAIDQMDANKLGNPDENLARFENGQPISLENRALPSNNESLALYTDGYTENDYTFVINNNNLPDDVEAYLVDDHTGNQTLLSEGENQISFTVDQNTPASIATDRFSIDFEIETFNIDDNELANSFKVYPNPVTDGQVSIQSNNMSGEATIFLYNMIGQRVFETQSSFEANGKMKVDLGNPPSGVYFIEIDQNGETAKERLIIK